MLTVAEALALKELAGAQVVAGAAGLARAISWVHVVGVPDAARWLHGGELILTTAINIPADEDGQRAYVRALAEKAVSGLGLAVGGYIDRAPAPLRDEAERAGLPLIEIHYEARFIDIVRGINERIVQENMALVTRALTINRVLTQVVLDGGDLKQLATTLADLIGQSISIENERFEALASANVAPVDEARRYTLSEGRTDPRLVQALHERAVIDQIRRTLRPVFIPQMPDVGLEMERILAPVVVHGDIYGYVWIIAHDRPLSDLDRMAIESAATIAALIMLYQEALQSAEASLKGSLLAQLIDGAAGREAVLTDQALRFGFDLTAPFVALLVETSSSARVIQLQRRVNRLAAAHNWPVVAGQFAGQVLALAPADDSVSARAAHLLAQDGGSQTRVGVSAAHRGTAGVAQAYHECRDVLHITERLRTPERVVFFSALGYLHTLYHAGPAALASSPHVPLVRRLLDEQQADLFNTLEQYLDAGGNGVQTAEALHIHRSTLNYRLQRIAEVCACDLSDPLTRTNLQIALKLLRLFDSPQAGRAG